MFVQQTHSCCVSDSRWPLLSLLVSMPTAAAYNSIGSIRSRKQLFVSSALAVVVGVVVAIDAAPHLLLLCLQTLHPSIYREDETHL